MNTTVLLLVDDEPHITEVMARHARKHGYEVHTASDGEEGFAVAMRCQPDAIVTDLQMPYCSGLEMAQRLAQTESTRHIPLVMLTARGYVVDKDELAKTNIKQLMCKPFSARKVLEALEAVKAMDKASLPRKAA